MQQNRPSKPWVVFKYHLETTEPTKLLLPEKSEIIAFAARPSCIWAQHPETGAKVERVFRIVGTGRLFGPEWRVLFTDHESCRPYVWHLLEQR